MATAQEIMDDAKSRYRHVYGDPTIIGWLNLVLIRLWKIVPRDSLPSVVILDGSEYYKLPTGIKRRHIKRITLGYAGGTFIPLEAVDIDEADKANSYRLSGDYIFLQEPEDEDHTYLMMIYYEKTSPTLVTEDNLDDEVDLDSSYQELLTLGLLELIAGARKDIKMKNNYTQDYLMLLSDFSLEAMNEDADYPSCRDEMPKRARYHHHHGDYLED